MMKRYLAPLLLVPVLCAGCQSGPGPVGSHGGRIDTYTETGADYGDERVSTVRLLEFADQVSEDLPMRIANIREFAERDYRAVLYLNEILNETNTPTSDFRLSMQQVRNSLINSSIVAQYAAVYSDPAKQRRARDRFVASESGGSLVDEGIAVDDQGGRRYSADDIFVLNAEVRESTRGGGAVSLYVFDMTVTEMATDRIVFSSQIIEKRVR